jgi:hypothetical protein
MTPDTVTQLTEKIIDHVLSHTYDPHTGVESLLREAMEKQAEQVSASANAQWDKICFKKIQEAYTRAAEVAREHNCLIEPQCSKAIAAAIEKLKDEK